MRWAPPAGKLDEMRETRKIVIAGAGVAALETLLALRALGVPRLDIVVLAPGDSFLYRPVSVAEGHTVRVG